MLLSNPDFVLYSVVGKLLWITQRKWLEGNGENDSRPLQPVKHSLQKASKHLIYGT